MELRKKKLCYKLKTRYKLTLFFLIILAIFLFFKNLYYILSPDEKIDTTYLVIEGWMSDYALEESLNIFRQDEYQHMFITGGPVNGGYYITNYKSTAESAKATLLLLGASEDSLTAVSRELVWKDRTYKTALQLKKYLRENHPEIKSFNLVSLGAHTARSWLLFRLAMPEYEIGVISMEQKRYDKDKWWTNSKGARAVFSEGLGYFYTLFFFKPYGV